MQTLEFRCFFFMWIPIVPPVTERDSKCPACPELEGHGDPTLSLVMSAVTPVSEFSTVNFSEETNS